MFELICALAFFENCDQLYIIQL